MKLRKIFSPHDARTLAAHAAKFQALPLKEPVITAQYPEFDGDMAELHELADRVIELAYPWWAETELAAATISENLDYLLNQPWPVDWAGLKLQEWQAQTWRDNYTTAMWDYVAQAGS